MPPAPHLDLVILVCTRDYPGSGDCGPHLGFTWIWGLWSPYGPNLTQLTMVLNWVNWAPVTLFHNWTSPDQVTLIPLWVSPCPSDCEPHFGLTRTC